MNKSNLIIIVLVMIILLGGFFMIMYYFNYQKNECLANPLIYGAKQLEEQIGYEFQGYGFFKTPPNYQIPELYFNSTNIFIKK